MNRSSSETNSAMLEILAAVGGKHALAALALAAKSDDANHQDIASRLLGTWNSVEAAPVLLDLAKTAPAEKYQIRALRGFIGVARKFPMPEQRRVEMCQQALDTAKRSAEQQLVLDVLKVHPSKPALNLLLKVEQNPELADAAKATAKVIKQKLSR